MPPIHAKTPTSTFITILNNCIDAPHNLALPNRHVIPSKHSNNRDAQPFIVLIWGYFRF